MSRLNAIVSTNIRVLMAAHDLPSSTVARVCGVSQATVCNWRKGRAVPQSGKIEALAAILGVEVSDLYTIRTGGK